MKNQSYSRRKFIGATSALATGVLLSTPQTFGIPSILKNYNKRTSLIKGVQIGVITYSFRSMPDQSAEATLKYIVDCGIDAVELMGDPAESFAGMPQSTVNRWAYYGLRRRQRDGEELTADETKEVEEMGKQLEAHNQEVASWRAKASMGKFEKLKKMYNDAGVSIYGFKPSAFSKNNTDAEIDYGFKAAKALGASHVTLEHPSDDDHTNKLGKMAKKHKILVAYHGHEQQTPTFWDTALAQSEYNAMNPDMGHFIAAGNEKPLDLIKKYHARIASMHLKDRHSPSNGKSNVVWGSGDTPIPEILQLLRDQQYKFPASIELEYDIPEGSDAVKEVTRCLDFCRQSIVTG